MLSGHGHGSPSLQHAPPAPQNSGHAPARRPHDSQQSGGGGKGGGGDGGSFGGGEGGGGEGGGALAAAVQVWVSKEGIL